MQENPDIRSQEEVKSIIIEFSNAKTQEEIEHVESKIRSLCSHEKNLYVLCDLIINPKTERSEKLLITSIFNVVLQELLKRLQEGNKNRLSRHENKRSEETKKIVMHFTSRLEKIIDGVQVSPEIKKIAIRIQLKLQFKSNDEFDVQRPLGKMDFYFRKQNSLVGINYFNNLVDLNMNLKQKVDIYIKVASNFPNIASTSFMKISQGKIQIRDDFNEYQNFEFIIEEFVSFVKGMPNEVVKENTLNWCNNDMFLTLIQSVDNQLDLCENKNNPNKFGVLCHPEEYIRVWKENLLVILEKVSANIHRHQVSNFCGKFINIFAGIVSKSYLNVYFPLSEENNNRLKEFSGEWIPLYTNAVKLKCFPREFMLSQNSIASQNEFDFCALSQDSKIFYMSHYLFRLYSILRDKAFLFMNSESKEDRNEFLDFFQFFSIDQQEEDNLEDFDLNFARFLQSIVETYPEVCYFTKKIIICLLFSYDKNYMSQVQWQVESEISAIEFCLSKFNIDRTQTIEMGLFLSLIFYRELNKDREFLKDCIEAFISKVAEDVDKESSIFKQEPIVVTIFMMVFENYLPEVPICVFSQDHVMYRFSNLTDRLILELSNTNNESILEVYISSIKKYAGLIKNLISHLKKIRQERYEKSRFDSSTHTLYYLQTFRNKIPIPFYAKLYQELIHYDIFRGNGEPLEETQKRVKEVLSQMIGYEESENKILYYHQIFEVLNTILSCEEYSNIYSLVFEWIKNLTKDSLQTRREFEDDSTALCLKLLKKPEIVVNLSQDDLRPFWIVVESIVDLFEWQEEFSDMEMISAYEENQERDKENKNRKKDQLLMMYLSIIQNCPSSLVFLIFKKAEKNLSLIVESMTLMNRKMEFSRQRPYHLEEISFLVILHKIIQFCNEQMNEEIIEKILSIFWKNLEFRNEFPFDFNYVNGKYNLLVVLLVRYKFVALNKVLEEKGSKIGEEIYHEIYFNEKNYRVEYDIGVFVRSAIETLYFIWSPLYHQSDIRILLQNAHLVIGACVFCLDRMHEGNRYFREEELTIDFLENKSRLPLISHFLYMREVIRAYLAYEPYFDEFEHLRSFYFKICEREETEKWFNQMMTMYVRQELHCSSYEEILAIHKIKKKDGSIAYRKTKAVDTEKYK